MTVKASAWAYVEITLKVEVKSAWGADCTVAQVHKQAKDEVLGRITALAEKGQLAGAIHGPMKVTAVMAEREI